MLRLVFLAVLLLLASRAVALDDTPLVRGWQTEDGMPSNTVRAIAQTPDGFIWAGTEGGLARFDGSRFATFGLREGMPSLPVRLLFATRDGTLWIGCVDGGLVRMNAGKFTRFTTKDGLPSNAVQAFTEDAGGTLWVGTSGGVARWSKERFEAVPNPPKASNAQALVARRSGDLWVHFGESVPRVWRDGAWKESPPPPPGGPYLLAAMAEDAEGALWAVTSSGPVLRHDGNGWQVFPLRQPPATLYPRPLAVGPGGAVCIGHLGAGVWERRGTEFVPVSADDGTGEPLVEALHFDRDGQLWVGTFSSGLLRLSPRQVEGCRLDPVGNSDPVRALLEVEPGVFWVGTQGAGFWRWEQGRAERVTTPTVTYGNALLRTRDGNIWLASHGALHQFRDGRHVATMRPPSPASGDTLQSLAEDAEGALWVGTGSGCVLHLRNGRLEVFAAGNGFGNILALAFTPDGALWAGTAKGGIRRFYEGKTSVFTKAHGLRADRVNALHVDAVGTLWAGTFLGGLARWQGDHFQSIGMEAGLPEDTLTQILDDTIGRLWLAGPRGLAAVAHTDLLAVFEGQAKVLHPQIFSRTDGMTSSDCLEMKPIRTNDGKLCFGTTRGFVRVDPRPVSTPQTSSPRVILDELFVDGELRFGPANASWPAAITLGPGPTRLDIRYTSPEFIAPGQMRFRYRLLGLENAWHEVAGQRSVNFTRLPPGQYRFEVDAAEAGGKWSDNPAGLAIELRPHFWQTNWFYPVCAFAVMLAAGIAVRWVDQRRAARALERQRAVDAERGRIAQDLHDDLGASLTQIAIFSELAQTDLAAPAQVAEHLEQIFVKAQGGTRALDEIVWATNPVHDSLESFVTHLSQQAQNLTRVAGLAYRREVQETLPALMLPATARHHLFLAAKEALHNVVKHAGAKKLWLRLGIEGEAFCVTVEDDGRGCAPDQAGPEADGLGNMRRRMAELGGTFTMKTAPDRGTSITMCVPLSALAGAAPR